LAKAGKSWIAEAEPHATLNKGDNALLPASLSLNYTAQSKTEVLITENFTQ
jgi:hypothetical protein